MFCPRCHREFPEEFSFCPFDGARTGKVPSLEHVRVSETNITDEMVLDRYVIRGFIGKGGMARVYLAEEVDTGRLATVKVLDRQYARDAQACERFLREARTVAMMEHPNIVGILGSGLREEDGAPFLVLEFLFGETLGDYLDREGTMGAELALPRLRQAASALGAAHDKGVVHRDVKPDNLFLIGETGHSYELKVLDFGLSKLQTSALTAAGIVLGTPRFMAPEQALAENVDARTDVYALGMVMYRIFTGRSAFEGLDDVETIAHQLLAPVPPPTQFAPTLDGRIEAVILAALRKRPEDRYASMAAFGDDLVRLSDPQAELWAQRPCEVHGYQPASTVGALVVESLAPLVEATSVRGGWSRSMPPPDK
jgi:serine/threonine-protein kinase